MVGYGFNPLFTRWIYAYGLSPEIIVVYRYGIPAIVMLPFAGSVRVHFRESLLSFAGGMSMGFGALGYFMPLTILPVSIFVMILFTYPLFSMIFGRIMLGFQLVGAHFGSAILILLG